MPSSAQVGKLYALKREMGMDQFDLLERASKVAGYDVAKLEELTVTQASLLISSIEDELGGIPA